VFELSLQALHLLVEVLSHLVLVFKLPCLAHDKVLGRLLDGGCVLLLKVVVFHELDQLGQVLIEAFELASELNILLP